MRTTRTYTMTTRARSVEQTRRRILDACAGLHVERPSNDISLDDVAGRAGCSVQTVLRHFGSRAELVEATIAHVTAEVREERAAPPGDVDTAVHVLVDHYEARGDGVLMLLAQERTEPLAARVTGQGRRMHRAWVEEVFAPFLDGHHDAEELVDLLVVATDVYSWKLLRRDRGLSRGSTETRLKRLVAAVLAHSPQE